MTTAMILAAGEGQRLRPLTLSIPKVMVPIDGRPLIDYHLIWLKKHGISDVVINLHYLGHKIQAYLGNGRYLDMRINYSPERDMLGTAGAVKKMEGKFNSTFVVLYGDVLTDLDLTAMVAFHRQSGAIATLALHELADVTGKGVVKIDSSRRIRAFEEKPAGLALSPSWVSGGVHILEPEALAFIEHDRPVDFGTDVFPKMLEADARLGAYLLSSKEYLQDIGTPQAYAQANLFAARHPGTLRTPDNTIASVSG